MKEVFDRRFMIVRFVLKHRSIGSGIENCMFR